MMVFLNDATKKSAAKVSVDGNSTGSRRARLERELFAGRYRPGQSVQLREIAAKYQLDDQSVLKAFAEFQAVGMAKLSGNFSAIIQIPNLKEMQDAYEIRAGLEEIAGRTAATALKGNTADLRRELEAMSVAATAISMPTPNTT